MLVIAIAFWLYGSYLTYRSDGQAQALQTFLAPLGFAFVIALYSALDRLSNSLGRHLDKWMWPSKRPSSFDDLP